MKTTPIFSTKAATGSILVLSLLSAYLIQASFVLFFWLLIGYGIFTEVVLLLIFKRKTSTWRETFSLHFNLAFRHIALFFVLISLWIGSVLIYCNEISPATLSTYTITNGVKTVQFQSMSHIATPQFYSQVANRIATARKNGSTIFFEGVRSEKKETLKQFQKALGMELESDTYDKLANFIGLTAQTPKNTGIDFNQDKNIDVNLEEVMKLYNQKAADKNNFETQLQTNNPANISKLLDEAQKTLTSTQKKFLSYIVRAIANGSLDAFSDEANMKNFGKEAILNTIIVERNRIVADAIIQSKEKNLFVLYGALHFSGIYNILTKNDSNWHIVKEELTLPY